MVMADAVVVQEPQQRSGAGDVRACACAVLGDERLRGSWERLRVR